MPTGHNQPVPNPDATSPREPRARRGPGDPAAWTRRRTLGLSALVGVLALVALVVVTGCSSSGSSNSANGGNATTSITSTAGATSSSGVAYGGRYGSSTSSSAPSAGPNGVNIVNYAFSPKSLTVKAGTTVSWKNLDQFAHEVKSAAGDPGAAFDLGQQGNGKTVTHTFTSPGTYHYYCNIHNYMTGTIVVTP